MRFMMLMLPGNYCDAPPDAKPSAEAIEQMMKFNHTLQKAGVLLALDGLHPPSAGVRVSVANGKAKVTDGPFGESKEVVGGYWIIDVSSRDEAVAWATRCPLTAGDTIEVRQVFEMTDFPEDVQKSTEEFEKVQQQSRA